MRTSRAILISRSLLLAGMGLALALAGGCGKGKDPRRGDGGMTCAADSDCDDGIPCTAETCGVGGICRANPIDERCMAGTVCDLTMGCVAAMDCATDAECDDSIDCTLDACGVGGRCNHMALNERCAGGQTCDAAMGGCVAGSGCGSDAECDDSIDCTLDTCGVDMGCNNMAISSRCPSGETCSPTLGCYVPMPCTVAADCQDGNFCNGAELCMPEFGCAPAESPRMCDDTDDCTIDSCDTTSDMCAFACDTSRTECMCPVAGPTCTGSFSLSPGVNYSCAFGMAAINLSTATFANVSGVLNVRPASSSFPDPLSDVSPPVCPMFEATATVAGGCDEHYTIRGTFSDDDHFTGTVEISFIQTDGFSCVVGACANQTVMVTGTRM